MGLQYTFSAADGRPLVVDESCYLCGVYFAITEELREQRLSDGRNFWCPNGHSQHFTDSMASKLKKQREQTARAERRADRERDSRRFAERQAHAYKGVATKVKKRIHNGVCPYCHRSFVALARHMKTKHKKGRKR